MTRYTSTVPLPRRQQENQDDSLRASVADLLDSLHRVRSERDSAYRECSRLRRRLDVSRQERDRLTREWVRLRQLPRTKRRSGKATDGQLQLWD